MTFAFEHWRNWLAGEKDRLVALGLRVKFAVGGHPSKQSTSLAFEGKRALADFSNWSSGETDFAIAVMVRKPLMPWRKDLKFLCHENGIIVDDTSFMPTFERFATRFWEAERQ